MTDSLLSVTILLLLALIALLELWARVRARPVEGRSELNDSIDTKLARQAALFYRAQAERHDDGTKGRS